MSAIDNLRVEWQVPRDHPAFPGHFPGRPIVPGVVLVDQALVLLGDVLGKPVAASRIGAAKFLSPVEPEETLAFCYAERNGAVNVSVKRIEATGEEQAVASVSFTLREEVQA